MTAFRIHLIMQDALNRVAETLDAAAVDAAGMHKHQRADATQPVDRRRELLAGAYGQQWRPGSSFASCRERLQRSQGTTTEGGIRIRARTDRRKEWADTRKTTC
jgi:hypothetical protein